MKPQRHLAQHHETSSPTLCTFCKSASKFKCGWCKLGSYCSKNCQKKDWYQHKRVCSWALNKHEARKSAEIERNRPSFIQAGGNITWYHPGRPYKSVFDKYREMAELTAFDYSFHEPASIAPTGIRELKSFDALLSVHVAGKSLSSSIISFEGGPSQHIDAVSLTSIIKKSRNGWRIISDHDAIISTILEFHYPYVPFCAAHLIIQLLSYRHGQNRLLREYVQRVKSSPHDEDIEFGRSEELFDSQKALTEQNMEHCIGKKLFRRLRSDFVDLVNYMNGNYWDCYVMTNHITDHRSFFYDVYVFVVGVTDIGGLSGVLMKIHDHEGDTF